MTIIDSIKEVLCKNDFGLTASDIFAKIIEKDLYQFKAKNPVAVVNGEIRRHCYGLVFPTASPIKYFKIAGFDGKKTKYKVLEDSVAIESKPLKGKDSAKDASEYLPEEK